MHHQHPQHAGFIAAHLAAKAHDVSEHDGGEAAGLGRRRLWRALFHEGDYPADSIQLSNGVRGWPEPGLVSLYIFGELHHSADKQM